MTERNRLQEWIGAADAEIQASYAENHAKARDPKRIQQTGHAAEHVWGDLLERWLPPQYEVAYRRYILPEIDPVGYEMRETDIVIFRPGYPTALRGKKEVLAAGVLAAFSVKLTLDRAGVTEAIAEAANVRRHTAPRLGTPRQETTQPFRYGVLAHAHNFGAKPRGNVAAAYDRADRLHSRHPRESLDLICIADLGVWSKLTSTCSPVWNDSERQKGNLVADHYSVQTTLIDNETALSSIHPRTSGADFASNDLSPLTVFISDLYSFLAQEDDMAEPFYRGLIGSSLSGSGMGSGREWSLEAVYSESVLSSIFGRLVNGREHEWGTAY